MRAKYMVIYRRRTTYSISKMCRFFKVSRSGYYAYVKRMKAPDPDLELALKIRECQKLCHSTYGYRRVHIWLERQGIHKDPKTILKVMQKYNLLSVPRRKNNRDFNTYTQRYPNLLNRNFHADAPNKKWVTDISTIHTAQGDLFICVIRDLYDNCIVAYKVSSKKNVNLVRLTLNAATAKEKVDSDLQLHSDRGFPYSTNEYNNIILDFALMPSMSCGGNPYDNALAENFFSILKSECLHRTKLKSFSQTKTLISSYIQFYNNERIQSDTGMTPFEKRLAFAQSNFLYSKQMEFFRSYADIGAYNDYCAEFLYNTPR